MKKVKDVAAELEVTRQTIYNHIEKLSPEIDRFIKQIDKAKVIEEPGIEMIRDNLGIDKQFDSSKVDVLKKENEMLREQLEYLKEQIDRKDARLDNYQYLMRSKDEEIRQIRGEVQEQQQGLLAKIKKYFTGQN